MNPSFAQPTLIVDYSDPIRVRWLISQVHEHGRLILAGYEFDLSKHPEFGHYERAKAYLERNIPAFADFFKLKKYNFFES